MESGRIVDTASAKAQLHGPIRAVRPVTIGSAAGDRREDGDLVVGTDGVAVEGRFAVAPHPATLDERRELGAVAPARVGDHFTDRVAVDVGATRAGRDTHGCEET